MFLPSLVLSAQHFGSSLAPSDFCLRQGLTPTANWIMNFKRDHAGYTLLDTVTAMAIIGILSAIAAPKATGFLDSIAVQGAANDAFAVFSAARHLAVSRGAQATVEIDTVRGVMSARVGTDTFRLRDLTLNHKVKLSATRNAITYSARGMGYGAGNLTLVIRRGTSVDSLFVSRLGRVRH